jgi:membrane protein
MTDDADRGHDGAAEDVAAHRLALLALRRTLDHGGTRLAAALTYYSTLSLAPAVIVLVSVVGLFGDESGARAAGILEALGEVAPAAVVDALEGSVESVTRGDSAGEFFWLGLALALWAASGYVGAFIWAADLACGSGRREPTWRRVPRQLAIAAASLLSLAVMTASVVATGAIASWVADVMGVGDTAVTVWSYGRWVLFVLVATFEFGLLYRLAPARQAFRLRWVSLGGFVAALLALLASLGFSMYVDDLGSYDRTYGALATFVIFLVWLWLVNLTLVFGFELNVTVASRREP